MHGEGPRVNGGIGFSVESPFITISATSSSSWSIEDRRSYGLTVESKTKLIYVLDRAFKTFSLKVPVSIEINGAASAHHGFGSGTAIRLSCVEALLIINGLTTDDSVLMQLSGRGGTSGVGINTYFSGGAIIDLGILSSTEKQKPSSIADNSVLPLVMQRIEMPSWDVGICIPENIRPLTFKEECVFFENTCPINESEAHKAFYYSIAGIFASIKEGNKEEFENGVRILQECEWKKTERKQHGGDLLSIERCLYDAGATVVGMSSLGPSLYFFAEDIDKTITAAKMVLTDSVFIKTRPSNTGRIIEC